MRTVLPGKPRPKLQAICAAQWGKQRIVAYVTGNALAVLDGPRHLLQTVYHERCSALDAVVFDEASGKIATCDTEEIYIYRPEQKEDGSWVWSFTFCIEHTDQEHGISSLSWGSDEELLVGSLSLRLYQTSGSESLIWDRRLSRPAKIASFSPDASLIASTGVYDRLIKLWRRQSFDSEDTRFDFTYLLHPAMVTSVHWRKPKDHEQRLENVLYTISADSKVRVWAGGDPHGLEVLQLCVDIDMQESLQPRQLDVSLQSKARYAFIVDNCDFTCLTDEAVGATTANTTHNDDVRTHLKEVAKTSPEICVVLDGKGNMSAWGLENVGCKVREPVRKFNIAHVANFELPFLQNFEAGKDNAQFINFCSGTTGSNLCLVLHSFEGQIAWLEASIYGILDPSPREERMKASAFWTGHEGSIKKIVRSNSGKAIMSRTNDNEGIIWKHEPHTNGSAMVRGSSLDCPEHIHRTCILDEGDFVVILHHHSVSLWDARLPHSHQILACSFEVQGKPLCLIILPKLTANSRVFHIATITSKMRGIAWEIYLPRLTHGRTGCQDEKPSMRQFSTFDLGYQADLAFVLPVDPAGVSLPTSSFLDTFAKDVAISYTDSGVLQSWTAQVDELKSTVDWLTTSTVETGIESPSLASGSSIRKIAVVDSDKTGLTIWDSPSGQLEHDVVYGALDSVQDLDWSSTPDDQSILAVGFPNKVVILTQMRYDYMNRGSAWAPIRELSINGLTPHPIGDSTWLANGQLVIGAGHQLFVYDDSIMGSEALVTKYMVPTHKERPMKLFDLVTFLNGPLPVFHPQFLAQCILAGKLAEMQKILVGLHKALLFFAPGDEIDSFLGLSPDLFYMEQIDLSYTARKELQSALASISDDDRDETLSESLAARLAENLAKLAVPQLSSPEQMRLVDIVECAATAEKHRRSMDENAMRYLLFFRQYMLRKSQGPANRLGISWREIIWAFHSGSQDILVDLVSKQFHGRMLWQDARESGMFMWMTDLPALRLQFEAIARNEYTKTDEKNPIDCSLYYLALKKKSVLSGLWRMAAWNREQSSTQRLLANNFQEPRWRTAALKNAYALLGKRRFEYAAAWFLLAGRLQDAVNVCVHQLQDLQLGVAIARVYEGDESPVIRSLLEDRVLPQAALEGNRWLATWAFWMLGRRDLAVRALILPIHTLLESPSTPNLQSRSYLSNDPALVVLYKQLRDKTLQTLKGASRISPRAEWEFVIQNARLYDRIGCDLLALDLVRNWTFLQPPPPSSSLADGSTPISNGNTHVLDPRKMMRRRSSLVVDDLSSPKSPTMNKPPPKVFEEPSSSSLLDNFGF